MNKKLTATSILFMVFVGFMLAGAVSAADWFNPTAPNTSEFPSKPVKPVDQGQKIYPNNPSTPWDDQRLAWQVTTPKAGHVYVRIEFQTKKQTTNTAYSANYYWFTTKYKTMDMWNVKKYKKFLRWKWGYKYYVRIHTWTSVNQGPPNWTIKSTSDTTKDVETKLSALQYYWKYKSSLLKI